jgi:hypothetical protein
MIVIDFLWRLVPYLFLSTAVWLLVINLAMLVSSLSVFFNLWFWVRFVGSVAVCWASCVWISRRYEDA